MKDDEPPREAPVVLPEALSPATLVQALQGLDSRFIQIEDLLAYARKVTSLGRCLQIQDGGRPVALLLYYENEEEFFVSMVWTHTAYRFRGYARVLLRHLSSQARIAGKAIRLEVHPANPANDLYRQLGYLAGAQRGDLLTMVRPTRAAIMQPYAFPYLGYFHLIEASDTFVFYDDVQYIKRGWVNRNNILVNGAPFRFTIPVAGATQNASIRDIAPCLDARWLDKFRTTLLQAYAHAPFRDPVASMTLEVLEREYASIGDLAIASITAVYDYLGLPFQSLKSSQLSPQTRGMDKVDRLVGLTRQLGHGAYVNAPGGATIYEKPAFKQRGVDLSFVKSEEVKYDQGENPFVPGLSIIDVLMHNSPGATTHLLSKFRYA